MQIKKIFLYAVPYTEDDHHQPLNSALPDEWKPIRVFNDIYAHLFNFGTSIELTTTYEEIKDANYAKFVILMDGDVQHDLQWETEYYAWIDGIDIKSYQLKGSVKILYHWDYWRSFVNDIVVLRGTITSRIPSITDPPQYVANITESYDTTLHYIAGQRDEILWVYMTTIEPGNEKGIQRIVFPVPSDSYNKKFKINDSSVDDPLMKYIDAPSFRELIDGSFLKKMKIEQNKLIGCSVTTIPPVYFEFDGSEDIPKITVDYHVSGFYTSIKTDDLIEEYGSTSKTYNDIHRVEFNKFRELPFTTEGYGSLNGKEELKWWCFPRNGGKIDYNDLKVFTASVYLFPPEEDKQYYPFLIYLKYYTSYYRSDFLKISFSETVPEVYHGSYEWKYNTPALVAPDFTQEFHVDLSRYITKIEKTSPDKFKVTFNQGEPLYNVGIDEILVKRKKKEENFNFYVSTEEIDTIKPKIYEGLIVISNINGVWPYRHYTFETPLSSTPLNNLYLLDNANYPITKFQQGRDLISYTVQAVSQNNEMFVLFRFNKGGYIENNEFVVNMTPIDLTQEYYNEYIISGERAAANERRFENIVSSLTNLAANTAIGTLIAGPGGGVAGGLKSIGKTLLAGGLTTGAVGGLLGYYQQNQLENRLQNRGSFLIRSGNDYSWITNGDLFRIVRTNFDSYSVEQYNNKVYEYGIDCNEIDKDGSYINLLIQKEGPIKLSSVTLDVHIDGDEVKEKIRYIPNEANVYIRRKLINGVFLDLSLSKPKNKS